MYHASSSADENISMNMGLGGPDGCGSNGMFNDASSTEADGRLHNQIYSIKERKVIYRKIFCHNCEIIIHQI